MACGACAGVHVSSLPTGKAGACSAALTCPTARLRQPEHTSSILAVHSACRVPNRASCIMIDDLSEVSSSGMKKMMEARLRDYGGAMFDENPAKHSWQSPHLDRIFTQEASQRKLVLAVACDSLAGWQHMHWTTHAASLRKLGACQPISKPSLCRTICLRQP